MIVSAHPATATPYISPQQHPHVVYDCRHSRTRRRTSPLPWAPTSAASRNTTACTPYPSSHVCATARSMGAEQQTSSISSSWRRSRPGGGGFLLFLLLLLLLLLLVLVLPVLLVLVLVLVVLLSP